MSTEHHEPRCECQETGQLISEYAAWYDEEAELPFVNHAPGECECTNGLTRYLSSDGVVRWLCSCCCTFGDKRLPDADAVGEVA